MEDVLDVYQRPYDPKRPVVCLDEGGKELHGTPQGHLPAQPGQPLRQDYEWERHGMTNLFVCVEPLTGWRSVRVTDRHTAVEVAYQLRDIVEVHFPDAEVVVLVTDNLNVHSPACLYEAFEPAQARRIARKVEWHYTPKHGSWLNMAEIELSVLARQCLSRRIQDKAMLIREAFAWERQRNQVGKPIKWRFTTTDARIKLAKLYPTYNRQLST
jgi:transposase